MIIERFLSCGDTTKGFLLFKCKNGCGVHYQGLTCKSKFCPKCGKKYRDQRTNQVSAKLLNVPHRQFVFTIPKEFRLYFQKYRFLLNSLYKSVNDSFNYLLGNHKGIAKKEKRRLGFISFLHTYGRDMKWNPHLHILVAERFINKDNELKNFSYFHFNKLRKAYMFFLTANVYNSLKQNNVPKDISKDVRSINKTLTEYYKDGFYVHGPKLKTISLRSMKILTKYITRYASHPPISERRISKVDYINHTVSWFYDPHEDDHLPEDENKKGRQFITEHVFDFMKRLLIHINDNNFKTIRYFGFYSNRSKLDNHSFLFEQSKLKQMHLNTFWIRGIYTTFGFNPLICDVCKNRMTLNLNESYLPRGNSP